MATPRRRIVKTLTQAPPVPRYNMNDDVQRAVEDLYINNVGILEIARQLSLPPDEARARYNKISRSYERLAAHMDEVWARAEVLKTMNRAYHQRDVCQRQLDFRMRKLEEAQVPVPPPAARRKRIEDLLAEDEPEKKEKPSFPFKEMESVRRWEQFIYSMQRDAARLSRPPQGADLEPWEKPGKPGGEVGQASPSEQVDAIRARHQEACRRLGSEKEVLTESLLEDLQKATGLIEDEDEI